jgi:hypothetical protein
LSEEWYAGNPLPTDTIKAEIARAVIKAHRAGQIDAIWNKAELKGMVIQ